MSAIVPQILIDDVVIHKSLAINKMGKVMDMLTDRNSGKMVKTASNGNEDLITLFSKMLSALNMTANGENLEGIIGKITAGSNDINKSASMNKSSVERRDDIKIVSKSIKDSHYQIDVSKDVIQKGGKKMLMVSCYARDSYLGRYLIKRNYFYTEDRNKAANDAYDEIMLKIASIKERYYNEVIDVHGIFEQIKQTLDGVISEIEMKEDSLGTTVSR